MSAQLVPIDASGCGTIPIQQPVLLVGRHPESDIRVASSLISRRHCCLAVVYDRVLIRDLGSRHGIYVNGLRVDEVELQLGDEVAIGPLIYRFEMVKPAAAAQALDFPSPSLEFIDEELIPLDD